MTPLFRFSSTMALSAAIFISCSTPKNENKESNDSTLVETVQAEATDVTGDFDGNGTKENVLTRLLNDANINPDEPWQYAIEFSDPKLKTLTVSPMTADGFVVLNEGDIDGKVGDELSLLICAMNNFGSLHLYRFIGNDWEEIAEPVDASCGVETEGGVTLDDLLINTDSGVYAQEYTMTDSDSATYKRREVILASASGDFDGNGSSENVYIKTIHDPSIDDAGYWEYRIDFSNPKLPFISMTDLMVGSCEVLSKGNVNGKPGDELAVETRGMMNKVITDVYSFNGKKWEKISSEATGGENAEP